MPDAISPNTGKPIGHWQPTPESEVDSVLAGLDRGLAALAGVELRRNGLVALADTLAKRKQALARVITAEVGKTPVEAADEVDYAVSFLAYGASQAGHAAERSCVVADRRLRVVSAGPALLITPFNDPLAGITRKIAPAIAAGCPAVVKPSSLGQLTAQALFEAVSDSGLGEVLHLVNHTDRNVTDRLVQSPQFRVLSFTGSTGVGIAIAGAAAGSLKRLVLELGGNNPFLVLEGADLDKAAADAIARKTRAAGQACSAQNRIYVVAPLYDAFRERLLSGFDQVTFGPADQGVVMGPVRTERAVRALQRLTAASRAAGAVHSLGKQTGGSGAFAFAPTVVESDAALRGEEAFGPMVSLTRVADRAEALAVAAGERQALACYLYGEIAEHETAGLHYGSIGINTTRIQGPDVPTGGFGTAGIGREGSTWGLEEYLTTINERWM